MFRNRIFSGCLSIIVVAGMLAFTACGDDNGTGPGSATVPDHSGANTPITAANAQQVMAVASTTIVASMGQIIAAVQKPARAAKSVNNVVINGTNSGTMTIQNGDGNYGSDGKVTLNADVVFDDFSNDGQIFMGGPVKIGLDVTLDLSNLFAGYSISYDIDGDLAFSGTYKGTVSMDLHVSVTAGGIPSYSGSVTVDGQTVTF